MREAGLVVASIHEALRGAIRPGMTTRELDEVSAQAIIDGGATSNFKGYYGYPATVCISANDGIVHGIPGDYEMPPSASLSARTSWRMLTSQRGSGPQAQSRVWTRTCCVSVASSTR